MKSGTSIEDQHKITYCTYYSLRVTMKSFAALFSAVAAVVPFVAADFIPAGSAAHFFSSQSTWLHTLPVQ